MRVAMSEYTIDPFVLVAGALALVLVNAVFVAAEFAIVRVRRTRLEELAGQGVETAKRAIVLVDHVSEYLAITQIAITAASLGVGWLGESIFARLFTLPFSDYNAPSAVLHVAAAVFVFLFITMIQVVVGELVPKNLAIRKAERLLLFLARPLEILHVALRPFHWLFEKVSSWILRCMGHGEISHPPLSEDELKLVLMDSHEEGIISEGEAKIIIRTFEFADKTAEEIMISAERVDFISLARTFEHNLALAQKNMHTRFPLCRNGLDTVVGIISMRDIWPLLQFAESNAAFERICRPLIKIPLDFPQDKILKLLQEGRGHMGVVRDSADTKTVGIVTLEDVLESLVGDVREAKQATTPPKRFA
jgi:CBS domain containing-hemolysin-like protein